MKYKELTDKQKDTLKELFPTLGNRKISKIMAISYEDIRRFAKYMRLRKVRSLPISEEVLDSFKNIRLPEVVWFSGIFWADGHITKGSHEIQLDLTESDGEAIKDALLRVLPFNIYTKKSSTKEDSKITMCFRKGCPRLHSILKDLGFDTKSILPPTKLLNKIPKYLHSFWWQGYFEGDGCIYFTKNDMPRVSFSGPVDQDWGFYKNLCEELGIKYKVRRRQQGRGSCSETSLSSLGECKKLLGYIYQYAPIGLKRKYLRYLKIKNKPEKSPKTSRYIGVFFFKKTGKWRSYCGEGGKTKCLGDFSSEDEAAIERDRFVQDRGLSLKLNFC